MVGETSDNLIGVPGVGPKTAAKWLQQYGDLAGVLAAKDSIGGKVGENLREFAENAVRNRRLNHLVRDLDFDFTFDELEIKGVDEEKVREVFKKLHFKTLTERVLRLKGSGSAATSKGSENESVVEEPTKSVFAELTIPENQPLDAKALGKWLDSQTTLVAVDVEFGENSILSIGFATETVRHTWAPKDTAEVKSVLGDWLVSATPKAIFDAKNTTRKLLQLGLDLLGADFDVLLMTYLQNPVRKGYGLDDIALEYLGLTVERADQDALIKEDSNDASLDAWLVANLSPVLFAKLTEEDQLRALNEIELPTSHALATMEFTGIQINRKQLEDLFESLGEEVTKIAAEAYAIIGKEIFSNLP